MGQGMPGSMQSGMQLPGLQNGMQAMQSGMQQQSSLPNVQNGMQAMQSGMQMQNVQNGMQMFGMMPRPAMPQQVGGHGAPQAQQSLGFAPPFPQQSPGACKGGF